jgi:hypothetical protein
MKLVSTHLGEYIEEQIHYGMKTGFNKAFIITAYLTDKVKEGESLWNATS